jgi:hypothetical protein
MGNFAVTLRATAALGFVGLLVGGLFASIGIALFSAISDGVDIKELLMSPLSALLIYPFALGYGILPAFLVCVPLYGLLRHYNYDSYISAAVTGVVPAAVLAASGEQAFAGFFAWYGVVVGLATHHAARTATAMAMRSNNSFKPKPLRGSA